MDRLAEILEEWRSVERAALSRSTSPDDRISLRRRSAWLRAEYLAAVDSGPAAGRDTHRDPALDRQLVDASNQTAGTLAELSVLARKLRVSDAEDLRSRRLKARIERVAADLV